MINGGKMFSRKILQVCALLLLRKLQAQYIILYLYKEDNNEKISTKECSDVRVECKAFIQERIACVFSYTARVVICIQRWRVGPNSNDTQNNFYFIFKFYIYIKNKPFNFILNNKVTNYSILKSWNLFPNIFWNYFT